MSIFVSFNTLFLYHIQYILLINHGTNLTFYFDCCNFLTKSIVKLILCWRPCKRSEAIRKKFPDCFATFARTMRRFFTNLIT